VWEEEGPMPILKSSEKLIMAVHSTSKARLFFSEEKNQKTFMSARVPRYPAMAWICPLAPN
jgi:hypothetical protein